MSRAPSSAVFESSVPEESPSADSADALVAPAWPEEAGVIGQPLLGNEGSALCPSQGSLLASRSAQQTALSTNPHHISSILAPYRCEGSSSCLVSSFYYTVDVDGLGKAHLALAA